MVRAGYHHSAIAGKTESFAVSPPTEISYTQFTTDHHKLAEMEFCAFVWLDGAFENLELNWLPRHKT